MGLNENQQKFINSTNVKKVVKFSLSFFIFSWKKFTFTPLYFELFLSYSLCVWFFFKKKKKKKIQFGSRVFQQGFILILDTILVMELAYVTWQCIIEKIN